MTDKPKPRPLGDDGTPRLHDVKTGELSPVTEGMLQRAWDVRTNPAAEIDDEEETTP